MASSRASRSVDVGGRGAAVVEPLAAVKALVAAGLTLRLYVNEHSPAVGDKLSAYKEADFPGYEAVDLDSWDVGEDALTHDPVPFRAAEDSEAAPVCGWLVTDAAETVIVAEQLAAPQDVSLMGDGITVTPALKGC